MPLYNYKCKNCRDSREYYVPLSSQNPERCDSCQFPGTLERLAIQGFSVGGSSESTKEKPSCKTFTYTVKAYLAVPVSTAGNN